MSDEFLENVIVKLMKQPDPMTALPPALEAVPDSTTAAIARCREAWQHAFAAHMKKNARKDKWGARKNASHEAAVAYRAAMPPLVGRPHIRDFIACAAYGILIEAIPPERAGQLLYAAQVALSVVGSLERTSKPEKPAAQSGAQSSLGQPATPPPPPENPPHQPQNPQ